MITKEIFSILKHVVGLKARNVRLGERAFVSMDFGKDIEIEVESCGGKQRYSRGEWRLLILKCVWRIDVNGKPLVGNGNRRDKIKRKLIVIENKKLTDFKITSKAFDATISFEGGISLYLFAHTSKGYEQWGIFTPERKVFIAGPANNSLFKDE